MPAAVARAIESKPLARRVLADDAYETLKALTGSERLINQLAEKIQAVINVTASR